MNYVEKDIYELVIPISGPRILQNFLTQYQPVGEEYSAMFRQFKREIEDSFTLRMTFSQQKAYDNRKLMFLNIYHPIIQACLTYFHKKDDKSKTSFCYALTSDNLLKSGETYYMAVYQMSVTRKLLGVPKHTETLFPILYSVNDRMIITDEELTDRVFSRSQTEGIEHNAKNSDVDLEMIQDMRYDLAEALSVEKSKRLGEIRLQVESDRQRNVQQTNEYYASVIDNQKRYIRDWQSYIECYTTDDNKRIKQLEGAIRLAQARVMQYEKDKDEKLAQINEASHLDISESIISLNLINII